ncbi:hypothetical protein [Hymenobacter lucidus]|nr:hypothetical protein [Hymenobacter lucidus]
MRRATTPRPDFNPTSFYPLFFYAGLLGFVFLSIFFTPLIQLLAD